jgi:hypothetical protein
MLRPKRLLPCIVRNGPVRIQSTRDVWVVSLGGTAGTAVGKNGAVPLAMKILLPVMMPIIKALGMMHGVEDGSDRSL